MSASALKNVIKQKTHRERGQLSARSKLGLLEKKKDYVLRAADYHSKQTRIKTMRSKASFKNPDEFYFAMQSHKTTNGIHKKTHEEPTLNKEEMSLMREQDDKYLRYVEGINRKQIEKLRNGLAVDLVDLEDSEDSDPRHTIFVDDDAQAQAFDAASHFNTHPSLLSHTSNRLTLPLLASTPLTTATRVSKTKTLALLKSRLDRQERLAKVLKETERVREAMGKGARKVVGVDHDGVKILRWRKERLR